MLTVKQVAQRLAVSAKSVYAAISRGELAAYRVAGAIRIAPADLDAYLTRCRIRPGGIRESVSRL